MSANCLHNWDDYFMGVAIWSAKRSKDPNTQVGSCIVNSENKIVGVGYNGMPIGCNDNEMPWTDSTDKLESKYSYVCHAEMNAVLNSNWNKMDNCVMYCTLFPCNECTKIILQCQKIKKIVYLDDKYHDQWIWGASRRMLDNARIKYAKFEISERISALINI